ncbi:MAG: Dihydrolipoyl dehydrogenase [Methanomassiliicoccales archaeon PtaU1.Bin124]|nr:MAG: Dihydrolipoyl dehydrogenase [Methanomassiliicoccales archaeon PtaU1.Bin124]
MKEYDLIVIGTGAGLSLASRARGKDMKVALVENGPLGGTCLNRGCIPSKVLIYPAEVRRMVEEARAVGVNALIESMDFELVHKRMWDIVLEDRHSIEEGVKQDPGIDLYRTNGRFTAPYTLQVGAEAIKAPRILISCGVRSQIPNIPGLAEVKYQTSETIFDITKLPKSLAILGGGYKACEFGNFFSAFGTDVKIIGRNPKLLPREEPEVSDLMLEKASKYMEVYVNQEVTEVQTSSGGKKVMFQDRASGQRREVEVEEILLSTGVVSNADLLNVTAGGIAVDKDNYVVVNPYLETNQPNVYALGDIIGRTMFRHTANYHVDVVWRNMFSKNKMPVDEHAVPHAVFGHPEVGSVGMTQAEAKSKGLKILVGTAAYYDTAKGYSMGEKDGFVKVVVDANTLKILGASVIGPQASILVQSVVYLMNAGDQTFIPMAHSQTIHPALSEVVVNAFGNLEDPDHHHDH